MDLIDKFLNKKTRNLLYIKNDPSPAANASLAIIEEVINKTIIKI